MLEAAPHRLPFMLFAEEFLSEMRNVNPVILLYGFNDREKLRRIQAAALSQRLQVKMAQRDEYELPVGVLAFCDKGEISIQKTLLHEAEKPEVSEAQNTAAGEFGELMVLAGLDNRQFNGFLTALRKFNAGSIPCKAVLTETNQRWSAFELYREVREEHERMTQKNYPGGK